MLVIWLVTCVILITLYIAALVRIQMGSKYRQITVIVGLLLISNIASLVIIYQNWQFFGQENYTMWLIWMLGIAQGIQDLTFSVSHHLLAVKFTCIAEEVPMILGGE